MTVRIPPDEALLNAYTKERESLHADRLRAVATLAAEQAVKEAVLRIGSRLMGLPSREYCDVMTVLTTDFPSAFTPTPPKEQQPVHTPHIPENIRRLVRRDDPEQSASPSPDPATVRLDEATVRACIETIEVHRQDRRASSFTSEEAHFDDGMERAIEHLSSLLPKPTPAPEPERYLPLSEALAIIRDSYAMVNSGPAWTRHARDVEVLLADAAAKRGPMLTPEQAAKLSREYFSAPPRDDDPLLAALRLAAKQGGAA